MFKIQISGFSWNISRFGQTGTHSHDNHQVKLSSHCPSDGQGSPIHYIPMTPCLYPTVSADIYHCTFNVIFMAKKISLCTHGSIKSGKTKHKPKWLSVSKKNGENTFLNIIKNYSDRCNSQSVSLSISLIPLLSSLVYINCLVPAGSSMLLSLQPLKTWGPDQGFSYKEGTQF